jgi:phosphonate transport system permease protein
MGLLDPRLWLAAGERWWQFAGSLIPPRLEVVPTLAIAMLETMEIALAGTLLGVALALPLGALASRALSDPWLTRATRLGLGALRTVPSILFGVVAVIAVGLGPAAGVVGVTLYTLGYLGKLYSEAFEGVDREVLEAVKSVGSSRLQLWRYAVLPETANAIVSQALFMFEYNIRASAIMGFVGAGGIGYYMLGYVQMLQDRELLSALAVTFVAVMVVDVVSLRLRRLVCSVFE